jgi:hypothetical protein
LWLSVQDYRGTKPFSEPESVAVRDFFAQHAPAGARKSVKRTYGGLNVAMNWHSYGQVINVPYSHMTSGEPPADDYEVFVNLAKRFVASNNFKYGQAWAGNGLYTVNGDAADYMYDTHGTFAFSPEVGPFFDFEPFERGMWPVPAHIAPIVNESLAMAGQSLWASDVLPVLSMENSMLRAVVPGDEADGCRTLYVQLAISNGGAVDSDSPVVLSATFSDGLQHITAAYEQATQPWLPEPPAADSDDVAQCAVPLSSASHRVLNDDYTHFKAESRMQQRRAVDDTSDQDRTAGAFRAAGKEARGGGSPTACEQTTKRQRATLSSVQLGVVPGERSWYPPRPSESCTGLMGWSTPTQGWFAVTGGCTSPPPYRARFPQLGAPQCPCLYACTRKAALLPRLAPALCEAVFGLLRKRQQGG